jgi:hypothetical protein
MRYLLIALLALPALTAYAVVSGDNNFGNYQQATGGLSVTTFYDVNTNGAFDAGEVELAGWNVTITNKATGQAVVASTPVAQTGLAAGTVYVVTASMPIQRNWKATAALTSASDNDAFPPLGGIAPLPLSALACSASRPVLMRGAQAALSPSFGAPATPGVWQAVQTLS